MRRNIQKLYSKFLMLEQLIWQTKHREISVNFRQRHAEKYHSFLSDSHKLMPSTNTKLKVETLLQSSLYYISILFTPLVWLLLIFLSGFASSSHLIVLFFDIASSAYVTLLFFLKKNFYYKFVHQNETSLLKLEHFYNEKMICKGNF